MGDRDSADDDRERAEKEQEDRDDEQKKDPYEDVAAQVTFTATTSAMLNP